MGVFHNCDSQIWSHTNMSCSRWKRGKIRRGSQYDGMLGVNIHIHTHVYITYIQESMEKGQGVAKVMICIYIHTYMYSYMYSYMYI